MYTYLLHRYPRSYYTKLVMFYYHLLFIYYHSAIIYSYYFILHLSLAVLLLCQVRFYVSLCTAHLLAKYDLHTDTYAQVS